jgi:hypothetical protein
MDGSDFGQIGNSNLCTAILKCYYAREIYEHFYERLEACISSKIYHIEWLCFGDKYTIPP